MPELPEVENVVRVLSQQLKSELQVSEVEVRSKGLRTLFNKNKLQSLTGQSLNRIERRAKYLIFYFEKVVVVSHLGMTGNWKVTELSNYTPEKHDHLILKFSNSWAWIYNDPRRFGDFVVYPDLKSWKNAELLGVEPLSDSLNAEFLFSKAKQSKTRIKSFLMDQRIVVGVGNIYACEVLFLSQIRPTRKANRVKYGEFVLLAKNIKDTLLDAIESGGSSIRDYVQPDSSRQGFQNKLNIYGKEDEACLICHSPVRNTRISGRSSFWCPNCQK